jgi:hypothetical protein
MPSAVKIENGFDAGRTAATGSQFQARQAEPSFAVAGGGVSLAVPYTATHATLAHLN